MKSPLYTFITVNFNGLRDTCELIESLQQQVRVDYEIIVIDNGSQQNEADMIQQKYPDVLAIRSEKNLGFAGGNNLALPLSHGEYLFFINNDALLSDSDGRGLSAYVERFRSDSSVGGISPKIRFAYSPKHIQYAGFTPLSRITLRNASVGYNEPDRGQHDICSPTAFLHGAAMIVPRRIIEAVGPMSDIFFLYYEEMDWCARIRRAGYRLWYDPTLTVYHKESQSTGKHSALQTFYLTRNRMLYAYRNLHGFNRVLSLSYLFLRAVVRINPTTFKAVVSFIRLKNKKTS